MAISDDQVGFRSHLRIHLRDHIRILDHPDLMQHILFVQFFGLDIRGALDCSLKDRINLVLGIGIEHKDITEVGFCRSGEVEAVDFWTGMGFLVGQDDAFFKVG